MHQMVNLRTQNVNFSSFLPSADLKSHFSTHRHMWGGYWDAQSFDWLKREAKPG
jgi:hypothetical protein